MQQIWKLGMFATICGITCILLLKNKEQVTTEQDFFFSDTYPNPEY